VLSFADRVGVGVVEQGRPWNPFMHFLLKLRGYDPATSLYGFAEAGYLFVSIRFIDEHIRGS
jgi:hypothetical protein